MSGLPGNNEDGSVEKNVKIELDNEEEGSVTGQIVGGIARAINRLKITKIPTRDVVRLADRVEQAATVIEETAYAAGRSWRGVSGRALAFSVAREAVPSLARGAVLGTSLLVSYETVQPNLFGWAGLPESFPWSDSENINDVRPVALGSIMSLGASGAIAGMFAGGVMGVGNVIWDSVTLRKVLPTSTGSAILSNASRVHLFSFGAYEITKGVLASLVGCEKNSYLGGTVIGGAGCVGVAVGRAIEMRHPFTHAEVSVESPKPSWREVWNTVRTLTFARSLPIGCLAFVALEYGRDDGSDDFDL
eukprot:m.300259 g.300259  ORF g.300259 m.300259 type:complete len:304 (+) comp16421_c1_seq13:283-1194(+)